MIALPTVLTEEESAPHIRAHLAGETTGCPSGDGGILDVSFERCERPPLKFDSSSALLVTIARDGALGRLLPLYFVLFAFVGMALRRSLRTWRGHRAAWVAMSDLASRPASSALILSSSWPRALITMMGADAHSRSRLVTSRPSMSGKPKSSKIRSGL